MFSYLPRVLASSAAPTNHMELNAVADVGVGLGMMARKRMNFARSVPGQGGCRCRAAI